MTSNERRHEVAERLRREAERTKLRREVYGEYMPDVYRCEKLDIRVERFDSSQNPISAAARCVYYEKGGRM